MLKESKVSMLSLKKPFLFIPISYILCLNISFATDENEEYGDNDLIDEIEITPLLMQAVKNNEAEIVRSLLISQKEININEQDVVGNTALMIAVHNKNLEIVLILLEHGADPNIPSDMYGTPLQYILKQIYELREDFLEHAKLDVLEVIQKATDDFNTSSVQEPLPSYEVLLFNIFSNILMTTSHVELSILMALASYYGPCKTALLERKSSYKKRQEEVRKYIEEFMEKNRKKNPDS